MSDLEDILEYCEAATEGPWRAFPYSCCPDMGSIYANGGKYKVCNGLIPQHYVHPMGIEDAEFAARARTDLPRVTAELIAARERIADLEESRDSWRHSAKTMGEELRRARRALETVGNKLEAAQDCYHRGLFAAAHNRVNEACAALADYERERGKG